MTNPAAAITAYWDGAGPNFDGEPDHSLRAADTAPPGRTFAECHQDTPHARKQPEPGAHLPGQRPFPGLPTDYPRAEGNPSAPARTADGR